MSDFSKYMFDTSFVEEAFTYLAETHAIRAWVVDAGNTVLLGSPEIELPASRRLFPFQHPDGGGLLCAAASEQELQKAEPHIRICFAAIQQLLNRETELRQTSAEMLQLSDQLHFLHKLANKIIGIGSLGELCAVVLREIGNAIGAGQAFMAADDQRTGPLEICWQLSADEAARLKAGLGRGLKAGITISTIQDGRSLLIAPLKEKGGPVGFMAFLREAEQPAFSSYEKKFVSIIENIISPTTETMRLYNSLQEIYLNTVKALAAAIDAKDKYTHGHSFRVAMYSRLIGRRMGFEDQTLADLEIAAYMHDLGKIGIPEAILGKPATLTPEEFEQIKQHPVFTDRILRPINLPDFIVDAAVHHHERLDGSGYPIGLQNDSISTFTRIIAVADVFDAMTSERPYRPAMKVERVLKALCGDIDTKFDRKVVLALVEALRDQAGEDILPEINMDLTFASIQNFNAFLLELIRILLEPACLCKDSEPPTSAAL